jgi:hypothetical protein
LLLSTELCRSDNPDWLLAVCERNVLKFCGGTAQHARR